ncbi:hypothetical protein [Streptomyces shenzhenensis]|uniref:hypothetical protein n=1 Tax=Streptomyces shenzhenensis TaxID=943815 RepID=UPI0015F10248|nr:hypothetical protein [Streptomyces shenzhenensis]
MVNFLDDQSDAKRFAALLADYDRRLRDLERTSKAAYTSIEGGTLDIYTEDGQLAGSVGVQPDGGIALVPEVTAATPPPTPGAPTVTSALSGVVVTWDGWWDDSNAPPTDFAAMQVHIGAAADFTPDVTTLAAAITDVSGGSVSIALNDYTECWVRLLALSTAGLFSAPSVAVQGKARQAVEQDLVDGMVTEVKLAESAVTAAKIALGAVGTTALADGAVLEDKLAKAAVTLGKIANGAVTINALGGALSDSAAQRYVDTMNDPNAWTVTDKGTGAAWQFLTGVTDAPTSQRVGQATGYNRLQGTTTIPYEPGVLYRVSARVRLKAGTSQTFYVGIAGIGADGTTLVNRNGTAGSPNSHYYVAASGRTITQADGWVQVIGFVKDRAAAGSAGPNNDPRSPGLMHNDVRFIAPYVWLNYNGIGTTSSDVMQVDCVTLEALKTGIVDSINFTAGAVNTAALAADAVTAGKVAADAIGTRELQANSVTASELTAGSVTAVAVAAGAITAEKLTVVGGANLLSDPSFEGVYSSNLVAGNTYFSIDTTGNGSAKSLKVNAIAAAATTRSVKITSVPILAGDQLFLAYDYLTSSDYTATAAPKLYAKWEDSTGATLGWGVAQPATLTAGDTTWTRVTATVTAPANAVQASIWAESFQASAGTLWFDNAAVRPVIAGVMIADGAITAPKILAGAITTDKLLALAVTAEKIASLAITTDKLNALSVTADKLAVNSVTATKIAAGVIDATHIKAGSLSADRLAIGADGGNLVADPSFEGAVSTNRVAGQTYWSLVAGGNGTAQALKVDSTAATATSREMTLVTLPAVPGQKMYLAYDYFASTDWAGTGVLMYAEWRNTAGTALTWANLHVPTPALGAWQRPAGVLLPAAPDSTAAVVIRLKVTGTAGSVLFDNVVARFVTASGYAGARAELSPLGLSLYDDEGEEAVALATGRPNYVTLSSDGVPVATIDQEGKAGFQSLAIADGLTIGGDDLTTILDQRPRGIIAYGVPATTVTSTGTEIGYFELPATIESGRMYRVKFHATADFDTANDGEARVYLRDGGASTPTITSTLRQQCILTPSHTGRYWTAELEHIAPASALGAGLHRFLLSFFNEGGTTGQTFELGLPTTGRSCYFIVEDIGPEIPKTGGYNTGGGTATPPVVQYTKTYSATWSGSYAARGSYNSYYGNSCMQGYYSSTNGMQASLIGFSSALGTDLSGATIQKAEVYLYFDHWYNNTGGTAVIKAHNFTSRPSTFSSDAESKSVSWAKNVGKWVDITSVFDSTKWRGIALDPNNSSTTYYGRARGYGQTNPPKLRVTYTK